MNQRTEVTESNLNVDAKEFRPKRNTVAIADARIQDISATNNESEI